MPNPLAASTDINRSSTALYYPGMTRSADLSLSSPCRAVGRASLARPTLNEPTAHGSQVLRPTLPALPAALLNHSYHQIYRCPLQEVDHYLATISITLNWLLWRGRLSIKDIMSCFRPRCFHSVCLVCFLSMVSVRGVMPVGSSCRVRRLNNGYSVEKSKWIGLSMGCWVVIGR